MQRRLELEITVDHFDSSKDHGNRCGYVATVRTLDSTYLITGMENTLRGSLIEAVDGLLDCITTDWFEMHAAVEGPDGMEDDA